MDGVYKLNGAKVSLEVIKKDIEQHAKNLINGKQLEYKDYDWELYSMISKINMRFYMTPEEVSLKQSMIDILEELRCEDKYKELQDPAGIVKLERGDFEYLKVPYNETQGTNN